MCLVLFFVDFFGLLSCTYLYFGVFFSFLLSSPGDTYSPSAFHQFHRAIMACLESIFCDFFLRIFLLTSFMFIPFNMEHIS